MYCRFDMPLVSIFKTLDFLSRFYPEYLLGERSQVLARVTLKPSRLVGLVEHFLSLVRFAWQAYFGHAVCSAYQRHPVSCHSRPL